MTFSDTENVTLCHSGKHGFDTGMSPPKPRPHNVNRSSSALSEQSMDGRRSTEKQLIIDEMLDCTMDSDDLGRTMPRLERGPSLLFPEPSTYVGGPADEELEAFDASVTAPVRTSSPSSRPASRGSGSGGRAQSSRPRAWAAGVQPARSSYSARR